MEDYLYHYGVKGMKWGHRKRIPESLSINESDHSITKQVKKDYNSMSNKEFGGKYSTTKRTYAKRVDKWGGDPYLYRTSKDRRKEVRRQDKHRYDTDDRERDIERYKRGGANRIERRVDEKGMSRSKARRRERGRRRIKKMGIGLIAIDIATKGALHRKGMSLVGKMLSNARDKTRDYTERQRRRRSTPRIAQNHYYDPIDVSWTYR